MSGKVSLADRSAGTQRVGGLVDTQVHALAAVLAANVRFALSQSRGAQAWDGDAVVDFHAFPITLSLLSDYRLPALACWRTRTSTSPSSRHRRSRRATFNVRYWLDATPREKLADFWPALHAAYEVIVATLNGDALINLELPGEPKTMPSTDLLGMAGFEFIYSDAIVGTTDFAVEAGGETGMLYPVLDVTFDADHAPLLDGLPYPTEPTWPLLESLVFELWDGTAVGGRADEDQPIVAGQAPRQ